MPINRDRITQVIAHLEAPRPFSPDFNMGVWFSSEDEGETTYASDLIDADHNECGTAACLAGTTVWLFRDELSLKDELESIKSTAADLLGLDEHQADWLFIARWRRPGLDLEHVTRGEVVTQLRQLLVAHA